MPTATTAARRTFTFDIRVDVGGSVRQPELGFARCCGSARRRFVTPVRIYDVDLATGERTLLREQPVLGDYRPEDYVERRDWAVAEDGARIPVSIIHRVGPAIPGPDTAVRLRRLRVLRGPAVLDRPAVAAGPRHGVRHRPCARRR